jgi:hypothetical protein
MLVRRRMARPSSGRGTLTVDGVRQDDREAALTPQVRTVDDVREIQEYMPSWSNAASPCP